MYMHLFLNVHFLMEYNFVGGECSRKVTIATVVGVAE